MPEGIDSKEEHKEYLKAIGYEKYVKDLQHYKDSSVGLNVTDKPILGLADVIKSVCEPHDFQPVFVDEYGYFQCTKCKAVQ